MCKLIFTWNIKITKIWPIFVFEKKDLDPEPVPGDHEIPGGSVVAVLGHIQVHKLS